MKQNKIIIASAFFALLTFVFAGTAIANDSSATVVVPVELKFLGNVKNLPLIQLDFFGSKAENEFSISITDEDGIELYSAEVKGEVFSKQFLLNIDDLGNAVLKFEIRGKRSGKTVSYTVNPRAIAKTGYPKS